MSFRPDPDTWVTAISDVAVLAFVTTMKVGDGAFHLPVFALAVAVCSGFVFVGLVVWGVLRLVVSRG